MWQADGSKVRRFAPVDFIGRYMPDFFDYAIADEVHELKGDTAQGNALGTLAGCAQRTVVLTGTLLGGYADEVFNILFRLEPAKMVREGFEYGEAGLRSFTETYGLLEKITVIEPSDNACSEARVTKRIRRRPGASPLLFGRFLMSLGAFISLEDISEALPPYREEVVSVEMDPPLRDAYKKLEEDIKKALQEHRRNPTVMSVALNALLLYPDRPFGLGDLYGYEYDPETQKARAIPHRGDAGFEPELRLRQGATSRRRGESGASARAVAARFMPSTRRSATSRAGSSGFSPMKESESRCSRRMCRQRRGRLGMNANSAQECKRSSATRNSSRPVSI